jgi:hypothetical protein
MRHVAIFLAGLLVGCTARADYMRLPGYDQAYQRCAAAAASIEDAAQHLHSIGDCLAREGFAPFIHFYLAGIRISSAARPSLPEGGATPRA